MAQKRMFDKAIIDTDRFMDLSMSSKALYFLLGMEADDEGFVSYKKVMRIHGGNEDDIKVLIGKKFLIAFESGVVVITDWNSNNYLNKHRIKETEYQKEKAQLFLNSADKYELGTEPTEIKGKVNTPLRTAQSFFKMEDSYHTLLAEFSMGNNAATIEKEFKRFVLYWTEPNPSGTKERWQLQKVFDVKRRLYTWFSKSNDFKTPSNKTANIAFA